MRAWGVLSVMSAIAVASCAQPASIRVVNPVIHLATDGKAPSSLSFTIKGGAADDRLLGISSPLVIRIALSDVAGNDRTATGAKDGIAVPAHATIWVDQGDRRALLFNVNPGVTLNEKVQVNFTFASGTILQAFAPTRGAI